MARKTSAKFVSDYNIKKVKKKLIKKKKPLK